MQPLDAEYIMKKKKSLKRQLLETVKSSTKLRIALLGGSSTQEIKSVLELFLLDKGIQPSFYESEYNKWYEDIAFGNTELDEFKPQIAIIHTSFVDLIDLPIITDNKEAVDKLIITLITSLNIAGENCRKNLLVQLYRIILIHLSIEA